MHRAARWSRVLLAATLPFLMAGTIVLPARTVSALGCGNSPQLTAPAAQTQERWRYTYDGAGSYRIAGWNPTEVTLMVNAPGCATSIMALVNIDLIGGGERWRVTSDQWEGMASTAVADTASGLVLLPTSHALYSYDDSTGTQLWSYGITDNSALIKIPAIASNIVVLSTGSSLTGINLGTGTMVWQQALPVSSVSDWEYIEGGPLVALGWPNVGGQNVFGIDPATGAILWQTPVGSTVASSGGLLNLTGNGTGLVVAEVMTGTTSELIALDATSGAIGWTAPLAPDSAYGRTYITSGAQPAVIYATGGATDVKSATAYDATTGALRWQNQNIGADAIMADSTHLIGAGPTLSYLNALVLVDGETGEMVWSQPYALVDGSFPGSAQVSNGALVFTPSAQEEPIPTVMGIDVTSGNVDWSMAYPEFATASFDGFAAGLALVTGTTETEAILVAIAP